MLIYTYDIRLVLASVAISLMAAFTGLALTRGLSGVSEGVRHLRIAMASIALGGGIWSMHFVAMLAMRFDTAVYYRALPTVASVLIAILLAGFALILMHFGRRTLPKQVLAGGVLGLGIVAMHYVGLSAIEGCTPVYRPEGFMVSGILAAAMGVAAIRVAYGRRSQRNILLATLIFGASVVIVHFSAMSWTDFLSASEGRVPTPAMDNGQLALVVLLSAFVISGAFLLSGASFLSAPSPDAVPGLSAAALAPLSPTPAPDPADPVPPPHASGAEAAPARGNGASAVRLPFEKDGTTYFLPASEIAAIRAEGHYSIAYTGSGRLFCSWSISEAEKRLIDTSFFRTHRSYLVNTDLVSGFERRKDNGICLFEGNPHLDKVPVSRSRVAALRDRLGL